MNNKKIYIINIIFLVLAFCIGIYVFNYLTKRSETVLKDENCYIIEQNEAFTEQDNFKDYYEANFNTNQVTLRRDDKRNKREKRGTLNNEKCEKLKKLIQEITSKKENEKEILEEEIHILYRKNYKYYYTIKSFDNKIYYVKDTDNIEKMQEILGEN